MRRALPWLIVAVVLAFVGWKLRTSHFDWAGFAASCRTADFRLILLAFVIISANYVIRALRWAVFLRPAFKQAGLTPVSGWKLVPSQFVGFTGLAIFGRIGELIRPLLVARRTGLSFSSQVAAVTVERVFDLAAFGMIFAFNLLLSPALQTLPYLHKAGYTIAILTLLLCLFVVGVRLAGGAVASAVAGLVGMISRPAAASAAEKILYFRDGLNVIDSFADFLLAAVYSVALWSLIVLSYVFVLRAFPAPVHQLGVAHTIVLLGFSIAGSALPIPGGSGAWAGNVFALTQLLGIPQELAVSAGLMAWLVTSMSVIPIGLVAAKIEGISLGQAVRGSEAAEATQSEA